MTKSQFRVKQNFFPKLTLKKVRLYIYTKVSKGTIANTFQTQICPPLLPFVNALLFYTLFLCFEQLFLFSFSLVVFPTVRILISLAHSFSSFKKVLFEWSPPLIVFHSISFCLKP